MHVLCFASLLAVAPAVAGDAADDERLLKEAHIATDGPGLLVFFRQRTVGSAGDDKRLQFLVKQLGDDEFSTREAATQQLIAVGIRARPALEQAIKDARGNDI